MKIPMNSVNGINGIGTFNHHGTAGGLNICNQYFLFPETEVITKVIRANAIVIVIFPVILAPPGNIGIIRELFVPVQD